MPPRGPDLELLVRLWYQRVSPEALLAMEAEERAVSCVVSCVYVKHSDCVCLCVCAMHNAVRACVCNRVRCVCGDANFTRRVIISDNIL